MLYDVYTNDLSSQLYQCVKPLVMRMAHKHSLMLCEYIGIT